MNEQELEKAKKKYKQLLKEQKKAICLDEEIAELKNNPYVREYIRLMQEKSKIIDSNSDVVLLAFDDIAQNTKRSNNILVYVGYIIYMSEKIYRYKDLETGEFINIKERNLLDFEKRNPDIIFPLEDPNHEIYSNSDYNGAYEFLRKKFFEDLISYRQNRCVTEIRKVKFIKRDNK